MWPFECYPYLYKCGGIAPIKATDAMSQPVGQRNGQLFTTPSPNNYITPEMYGAKGDGVTDDTNAVLEALAAANKKCPVVFGNKTYFFANGLNIITQDNIIIGSSNGTIDSNNNHVGTLFTSGNASYVVRISEYNNIIEGIATKGSDVGFYVKIDRTGYSTIYGIRMKNCHSFDATTAGYEIFSSVNSIFEYCTATLTPIGFYMPADVANSTMAAFDHCWVRQISNNGFELNYLYYASLTDCGCDEATNYAYQLNYCKSVTITGCGAEYIGTVAHCNNCDGISINGIYGAVANSDNSRNASIVESTNSQNITITGLSGYQATGTPVYMDNTGVYILGANGANRSPNMSDIFTLARSYQDIVFVAMPDPTQDYYAPATHTYYLALITMFNADGTVSNCYNTKLSANELIIPHDNTRSGICLCIPISGWQI